MFDLMAPAVYVLVGFDELPENKRPAVTFQRAGLDVIEEYNISRNAIEFAVTAKVKAMEKDGEFTPYETFKRNMILNSKEEQRASHDASDEAGAVPFEWIPLDEDDIASEYDDYKWRTAYAQIPNAWAPQMKVCLKCVDGLRNFAMRGKPLVWSEIDEQMRKTVLNQMGSGTIASINIASLANSIIAGIDAEGKPGFERIASDDGSSPTEG